MTKRWKWKYFHCLVTKLRKWPISLMWRNRDGDFPLEWRSHERRKKNFPMNHERCNIFPMNGGAGVVKINFPMSGEAVNGGIYFYHDCCAMNGENIICLEWWMGKFVRPYFSTLRDLHSHIISENFIRSCLNICSFEEENKDFIKTNH